MLKQSFPLVAGLIFFGAVLAQVIAVGTTTDVRGLVTVSEGTTMHSSLTGNPVINGSRFVTSSTGYVTLKFENGCEVKLKPNQSLTVDRERNCAALWASIESVAGPVGAFALGAGALPLPAGTNGVLIGLGVLAGAALLLDSGGGTAAAQGVGSIIPPLLSNQ